MLLQMLQDPLAGSVRRDGITGARGAPRWVPRRWQQA